jgi:hypothetical protein
MRRLFSRVLLVLVCAATIACTTPRNVEAAPAQLSPQPGLSWLSDPIDVPWGG